MDWIAHGFELVQSHYPAWQFQAADTVADNALHGALFVGPRKEPASLGPGLADRLARFQIDLSCNGTLRETGCGANVLGSPLAALAHLLTALAERPADEAIQAGELVTTGTLTRAYPVHAGETWSTTLDGIDLPGMRIVFEA
ncbi:2-hydroxyhexa-2,4-dienoate hydratase [compost metagenome]